MNNSEPSQENSNNRIRKGRGPAILRRLTKRNDGEQLEVIYNHNGQPIGSNRSDFASYKGLLARQMVAISYRTWHKVPKHLKENLWISIQAKFKVDPRTKKRVISDIGYLWKNFKGELTKNYIKPFKSYTNEIWERPYRYRKFITQEDWDEFVRLRLTEQFQKLSAEQVERRAKHKYNHRIGKLGYAGFAEFLRQHYKDPFDEDDRSFMWVKARQTKNEEYHDQATKEVRERIDSLRSQVKDGTLLIEGTSDILALALGTSERNGQVRGLGKGVTPTSYFHIARRGSKEHIVNLESKLREMEEMLKDKEEHVKALMEKLIKFQIGSDASIGVEKIATTTQQSESKRYTKNDKFKDNGKRQSQTLSLGPKSNIGKFKGNRRRRSQTPLLSPKSNIGRFKDNRRRRSQTPLLSPKSNIGKFKDNDKLHSRTPPMSPKTNIGKFKDNRKLQSQTPLLIPKSNIGKGHPCRLALGCNKNIVAAGLVFEGAGPNDKIHHARLGDKHRRVSIDVVYSPDAHLPVPVFHADMITLKDVHRSHVAWPTELVLLDMETKSNQSCGGKGAIIAFANMLDTIMLTDAIEIPMNIFGDNLKTTYVLKNELVRFCKMEKLDIVCVIAYMRCLYEKLEGNNQNVRFINPVSARDAYLEKTLNQFITKEMQSAKLNQVFFMPFNLGYHWVLVVIDYTSMKVFWLDSLHGKPNLEFKLYMDTALVVNGKRMASPTWEYIEGPHQLGSIECGFYVLKFMKELIGDPSKSIEVKMKQLVGKEMYESQEIYELQHEFIEFIQEYMN